MVMSAAISPGTFIILICLQNILAQQCLNNVVQRNLGGSPQQSQSKPAGGLNQIAQNSGQTNSPQQAYLQQMNFQEQSNIQQAPFTQQASNLQPQMNLQQSGTQQPVKSITNSQLQQQQNQNLATNIFSSLNNIRQPSQNQGSHNMAIANPSQQTNCCGSKQKNEQTSSQSQPQNQPSPTFTILTPIINKPQTVNQPAPVPTSFPEYPQYQPAVAFQPVHSNNIPSQQNQQVFTPPAQNSFVNSQNQGNPIQNSPVSNFVTSEQSTTLQSPIVMVPGSQINTPQSQPIVITLQPAQMSLMQNQPTLPTSQSQPIFYTVQTQPSSTRNQNHQIVSNQPQGPNNSAMDNQSLLYYIMSQMQNPQGNQNPLASILPAMLNTKSEKSSSMKTLLPLILSMLNDKGNGCVCPHCGSNNNDNQNTPEPIINTGYSNQKSYSQLEPINEVLSKFSEHLETSKQSTKSAADKNINKDIEITNNSAEISEEEDEEEDSVEDYEDE